MIDFIKRKWRFLKKTRVLIFLRYSVLIVSIIAGLVFFIWFYPEQQISSSEKLTANEIKITAALRGGWKPPLKQPAKRPSARATERRRIEGMRVPDQRGVCAHPSVRRRGGRATEGPPGRSQNGQRPGRFPGRERRGRSPAVSARTTPRSGSAPCSPHHRARA